MLYHFLRRTWLEDRHHDRAQPALVDVFAVDLFAHHLWLSSRFAMTPAGYDETSVRSVIRRHRNRFARKQCVFVTDLLLFKISAHKSRIRYWSSDERGSSLTTSLFNADNLHRLVVTFSVERLITLLQALSSKFSSKFAVATADYEAMHAYRCGMYERCMELCEWRVRHVVGCRQTLSNACVRLSVTPARR
jgi:hypothetical protein